MIITINKVKSKIAKYIMKPRFLKSSRKIRKFKNMYCGKRCFIIGNGPSLRTEDLEKLNGEYCFGSHRIYKVFDETAWRPNFYCAQDQALIMNSLNDINELKIDNVFIAFPENTWIKKFFNNAFFVKIILQDFYPSLPVFSEDVSKKIYEGYTVTYMCLQLAIYMGFKEIYLLGIDHSYSVDMTPDGTINKDKSVQDHFNKNDVITNVPQTYKSTLAYVAAKKYADSHGIKIYNATRGGKLDVFPRVLFDELF